MKKIINDPFLKSLPTIDLHGFDKEGARVELIDFINDNVKLKENKIMVIHGKGSNILKDMVHVVLKQNKYVTDYHLYGLNVGCTIVYLDIKKLH